LNKDRSSKMKILKKHITS